MQLVADRDLEALAPDLALELVRGAARDRHAVVDDHDVIGQAVRLLEVLGRHEHRRAATGQAGDEVPHREAPLRVEAGGRLVEEHDRRLGHERGAEVQAPAHAAGVGLDGPIGRIGQLEALEERIGALLDRLRVDAVEATDHAEVLASGEQLVECGVLAGHADPLARLRRLAQDVDAGHAGRSAVGVGEGREDAHRGRLAGAVRAEHAEDRALADVEVQPAQGVRLAEGLVEADGLDHRVRHVIARSVVSSMIAPLAIGQMTDGSVPPDR